MEDTEEESGDEPYVGEGVLRHIANESVTIKGVKVRARVDVINVVADDSGNSIWGGALGLNCSGVDRGEALDLDGMRFNRNKDSLTSQSLGGVGKG